MLEAILPMLASGPVGLLVGGVTAFFKGKQELEARRLELQFQDKKFAHEITLRKSDLEIAQAEAQGKKDVAIVEGDSAVEAARMAAMAQASVSDAVTSDQLKEAGPIGKVFLAFVGGLQKLLRPGLTLYLVILAAGVNGLILAAWPSTYPTLPPEQKIKVIMDAVSWVTGQASAVLGYWFYQRASASRG
jgi:hypothetical protein